jgi:hypothetical protein
MAILYRKIRVIALSLYLGALLISSCQNTVFGGVMSVDEMKVIIWDLMKVDELNNIQSMKDTSFASKKMNFAYYEQVFKLHQVSREDFFQSMKYYESHPPEMKVLIDSLDQYSARERNKVFQPDVRMGNGFGNPGKTPQ